jgi:zinc/manganese transport system substrate-binding protein
VLLAVVATELAGCGSASSGSGSSKIAVVAAENQYGSMAQAIGGNRVTVTSLLNNPNTDPHEFEASASTARTVASAQLVIKNGLGYDSWMDKLLGASPRSGRIVFTVGEYLGYRTGDNPHVWYNPTGWSKEASVIAADLGKLDPKNRAYFQRQARAWLASLQPVSREIATIRPRTNGKNVIATEPVYGYMIAALGATSLDSAFQTAVMNGTDPSPRSVAAFQAALRDRTAHMLFYNSQVVDPTTTTMRNRAKQSGVPVVGVTETQPPNVSFERWQLSQLQQVKQNWK